MDAIASILYWVQLGLLLLAVIAAILVAVRSSGSRVVVPWRAVTEAVLAAAVFAVAFVLAGAGSSVLWTVVLVALGAGSGYLLGAAERVVADERGPGVRRAAAVPWVWALSLVLVALTLLFGSTFLYGLAVLVMALALGLVVGQVAGELVAASRARAGAPAQPAA
jgi:hypothetical protein